MKAIITISFLTILSFSSCIKQENCPRYFQVPFDLSPINIEYHVGDTLKVISKFSRHVLAYNGERNAIGRFDMKGILWKPVSVLFRIDSIEIKDNPRYSDFTSNFEYIKQVDMNYNVTPQTDYGNMLWGEYHYSNDTFYLSYNVVCKKPGIYLLENSSDIIPGHGAQDFPGSCSKRNGFDVWVLMNGGINNHVELLKESPDPHWNTWLVQQEKDNKLFSELGGYCFKVIP